MGLLVGTFVGACVGVVVGRCVGEFVGAPVIGAFVGLVVGRCVGILVGESDTGPFVGLEVTGAVVGKDDGRFVTGDFVGALVGDFVAASTSIPDIIALFMTGLNSIFKTPLVTVTGFGVWYTNAARKPDAATMSNFFRCDTPSISTSILRAPSARYSLRK